jgi:hypothetical protein
MPLGASRAYGALPVPPRDGGVALTAIRGATTASRASASRLRVILRHLVAFGLRARCTAGRMIGIAQRERRAAWNPTSCALVFEHDRAAIAADVDGDVVAIVEFGVDDMTGRRSRARRGAYACSPAWSTIARTRTRQEGASGD